MNTYFRNVHVQAVMLCAGGYGTIKIQYQSADRRNMKTENETDLRIFLGKYEKVSCHFFFVKVSSVEAWNYERYWQMKKSYEVLLEDQPYFPFELNKNVFCKRTKTKQDLNKW